MITLFKNLPKCPLRNIVHTSHFSSTSGNDKIISAIADQELKTQVNTSSLFDKEKFYANMSKEGLKGFANEQLIHSIKNAIQDPAFIDQYFLEKFGVKKEDLDKEQLKQVFSNIKTIATASHLELTYATAMVGIDLTESGFREKSVNNTDRLVEIVDKVAEKINETDKVQKSFIAAGKIGDNLKGISEMKLNDTIIAAKGVQDNITQNLPSVGSAKEKLSSLRLTSFSDMWKRE
jgi:hypothetical protein